MKQWMKKRKSRGFTLVELLIVIVIIGILAGSLLLVMGSGTDKANATKVVSDMRTLKAAALMYYADNDAWPATAADVDQLSSYLDRTPSNPVAVYSIVADSPVSGDVAIKAVITGDKIKDLVEGMASESGVFNADLSTVYDQTNDAYMIIKK